MSLIEPSTERPATEPGLISHGTDADHEETDAALLERIRARLLAAGDVPGATVGQLLSLADALASFDLGRFLLRHRGWNAYWTHRLVTYQPGTLPASSAEGLEYQLFEKLPTVLATRERFGIFRSQLQARMKPGTTAASVPCGLMGDLLLLDYSGLPDVRLIGVDLDPAALDGARALAEMRGLAGRVSLSHKDAWALNLRGSVDVLASNGLNIYEPNDGRVTELYCAYREALRPGGTLVTSFLTPPPALSPASPWNMDAIDPKALSLQTMLFAKIIEAKWQTFRTHAQTLRQLQHAGFVNIRFIDDRARIFPTVIAQRPR
ncbi:SAM-dependent methyltransferase [Ralstonia solanacearum]|uniref:SAM-dependent methyltransferase n=1 Tax=Ralstonia solanacearum TaxID=305 RepID=A0AAD0WFJ7_RALSL|nr:class I SAM-dependent methyltransferase [Ralstonia solanacearum]AXV80958.1 SAM-dependent methyltransferase [Ralstonia solanacearum]AXW52102.1 SAM-dependent methyltransferase [Ralstonia solanacearum]